MSTDHVYPEEAMEQSWVRKLRIADGTDPDDYLDYLFGSRRKDGLQQEETEV